MRPITHGHTSTRGLVGRLPELQSAYASPAEVVIQRVTTLGAIMGEHPWERPAQDDHPISMPISLAMIPAIGYYMPMQPFQRATIKDVAKAAGVSSATVSRVFAGNYPVADSTRTRVIAAADSLNYVMNTHARGLAGAGPGTVAFLLDDVRGAGFADAAYGVEQMARRLGRLSVVCVTDGDPGREWDMLQMMREQQAEAIILIGSVVDTPEYQRRMSSFALSLHASGSALVFCGRPALHDPAPIIVVDYDNEGGAYSITSHLLSQGHRRILMLAGDPARSTTKSRVTGYRRAVADFGGVQDDQLIDYGSYRDGRDRTLARLASTPDFTAIFAESDAVAASAIEALGDRGLSVPKDISVVGYDDIDLARFLSPKLTTVSVPYEEMGRRAVSLALEGTNPRERVTLGTVVQIRQSVERRSPSTR